MNYRMMHFPNGSTFYTTWTLFEMTKEGEGSTTDEGNYNMYSVLGIIRYIILL